MTATHAPINEAPAHAEKSRTRLNTKVVMTASSVLMGAIGIAASFLPHELLDLVNIEPADPLPLLVQLMGAMYFAFAMQNWMARYKLVGGIYSKPISVGNFAHFGIGAFALVHSLVAHPSTAWLWVASLAFVTFAVLFGYVFLTNPTATSSSRDR